jgi:hypothetical protein
VAAKFDVASRLAEARPAVDNTQSYVWACHLLNYQNADLTQHSAQIRDWFSSDDGMDLHVLDADCASLHAAATASDGALAQQREQLTHLSTVWQGAGGASAEDFVRRHCDAAEKVTSSVRAAAEAVAGLRDTLWQIVDTKAAAVSAIDDRHSSERPAWLAAAQTVITGVGDRVAASELVDRQIKPFVDNDIRVDWLTAVRTAMTSIGSSYDSATAGLTSAPPARFDLPSDFGPGAPPSRHDAPPPREPEPARGSAPEAPAPYPAGAPQYLPPAGLPASPPMTTPAAGGVPAATGAPAPLPPTPGQPEGLPQQLGDLLSGLLPTPGDESPLLDPTAPDKPGGDEQPDEPDPEKKIAHKPGDENQCGEDKDTRSEPDEPAVEPDTTSAEDPPAAPPADPPAPPPDPPAPPPDPPAPPPPVDPTKTPCEIAADELPQAGQ